MNNRHILHIYSDFDCRLSVEGTTFEMVKNNSLPQVFFASEETVFAVYPNWRNTFSYEFSIKNPGKHTSSLFFPNGTIEMHLHEPFVETQSCIIFEKTIEHCGEVISLKIENCPKTKISITCNGKQKTHRTQMLLKNISAEILELQRNDFIKIVSQNEKESHYVALFVLPEIDNFYFFICDDFSVEADQITIKSFYNDLFGHESIKIIKPSRDKIEVLENFIALPKNHPSPLITDSNIGIAFFQALKAKNTKLAKSFLSEKLQSVFNQTTIKDFFGNFESCKEIPGMKNCFCLTNKSNHKFFEIKIQNSRIVDITSIDS